MSFSAMGGEEMSLFPEIDAEKTAARARDFLGDDLPRFLNRAGRPLSDLTGIDYSSNVGGSSGPKLNFEEISLINRLADREYCSTVIDCVVQTLATMRDSRDYHCHRTIIIDSYVKRWSDLEVAPVVGLSPASLAPHKQAALLEFAETFDFKKASCGCGNLPDLTVYTVEAEL